ncbi:unnamed protein product [Vitrella brassicaformis CCMP3155]|uniref:TLDc domain-containing protein n=2 Tax=Vitrella brassicaformis TaxID=1169539 RepID=A0A0G4ECG0_VITBC|nr:unnamed protein product [Vitrella brassicaformis CCMP3155]|mmetsp:Transcript_6174/g.14876  ORF Transcript_6174/g.14876 Transcript_6174/m.14876 type:complete len:243 (+) Transcript_6174:179-907(+)|eukprot:CEL93636.1 unnamed protein product [Vitrella brassicaformis CCMP3155]
MVALRGMMLLALAVTLALCVTGSDAFMSPTNTTQVRRLQESRPPSDSSLSQSEYDNLRGLLGNDTALTMLYRASRNGVTYGDMLDRVGNKTDLVIVIRNAQYVFGVYISEGIRLPAFDGSGMMPGWHGYGSDVWLFSLAGHYENATKWSPLQKIVLVASRRGFVPRRNARVTVGGLWLGNGNGWSRDDIRECTHFHGVSWGVPMPEGYMGALYHHSVLGGPYYVLGGSWDFTADELEILSVQ